MKFAVLVPQAGRPGLDVSANYTKRSALISSKLRPSPSSVADLRVSCCHRHTMTVHLDEASFTIVGVLPPDFPAFLGGDDAQIFMPLGYDLGARDSCRGCQHLRLVGRLKPGVTAIQASAELNTLMAQVARENPTSYSPDISVRVTPLRDYILGRVSKALWILSAAVGFVLLIACVNVANLLLARASGRSKEITLRAALGAGRARLIRQLLTESVLLAITGGMAGIALGWLGTKAFIRFAPSEIPRVNEIRIDATVLLFSLAASLLTGILFGHVPAFRASRVDLSDAMKKAGKSTAGRSGVRGVLWGLGFQKGSVHRAHFGSQKGRQV